MRFDLSGLGALPVTRTLRILRATGVICFAIFAFFVVAAPTYYYLSNHGFAGWTVAQTVALVFVAFLSVMGLLIVAAGAPPPTSVEVTAEGVAFESNGRPTWKISWADPDLSLRVFRTAGSTRGGQQSPPMIVAMGRLSSRNYLTMEAYDEIISQAVVRGLRVTDGPASRPGWTRTVIAHA